ncbi:MAG: BrnT family toxin [Oxalobacter formigenes]|nr:BrnT family toxin [Oxalobacter formigenes]
MTAIKRNQIIFPSSEEDRAITAAALADPDAPPLTETQLAGMQRLGHHFTDSENRLHMVRTTPGRGCLARTLYKSTAAVTIRPCLSTRPEYVPPAADKENVPCFYCAYKKEGGPGFCKRSKCMEVVFDFARDAPNKNRHKVFLADAAHLDWSSVVALSCTDKEGRIGLGLIEQRVHVVVFADMGGLRRIISLRRANLKESLHYAGQTAQGGMQGSRGQAT